MPGIATAHRKLAGASLLAVVLAVLGSVASLIEIINAPAAALRWAGRRRGSRSWS